MKSHFIKVDTFDNTTGPDNDPDNYSQAANINYSSDSRVKYSAMIPKNHWQPLRQDQDLETFVNSVESGFVSYKSPKPRTDKPTYKSCPQTIQLAWMGACLKTEMGEAMQNQ